MPKYIVEITRTVKQTVRTMPITADSEEEAKGYVKDWAVPQWPDGHYATKREIDSPSTVVRRVA